MQNICGEMQYFVWSGDIATLCSQMHSGVKMEKQCNNELLDECERGNKISPLQHTCSRGAIVLPLKHLSLLTYFLTYEDGGDYFSSRIETPKAGYPSPCAAAGRLWPSSHSLGHLSQTRLGSLPYDRAILSPECHRGTSGRVLAPRIECSLGLGMDVWTMTDVSGLISRAECEGSFTGTVST